ncbi:hypothetical protein V8F20_003722 [Naviculisporaceae sp. PSN 640]
MFSSLSSPFSNSQHGVLCGRLEKLRAKVFVAVTVTLNQKSLAWATQPSTVGCPDYRIGSWNLGGQRYLWIHPSSPVYPLVTTLVSPIPSYSPDIPPIPPSAKWTIEHFPSSTSPSSTTAFYPIFNLCCVNCCLLFSLLSIHSLVRSFFTNCSTLGFWLYLVILILPCHNHHDCSTALIPVT